MTRPVSDAGDDADPQHLVVGDVHRRSHDRRSAAADPDGEVELTGPQRNDQPECDHDGDGRAGGEVAPRGPLTDVGRVAEQQEGCDQEDQADRQGPGLERECRDDSSAGASAFRWRRLLVGHPSPRHWWVPSYRSLVHHPCQVDRHADAEPVGTYAARHPVAGQRPCSWFARPSGSLMRRSVLSNRPARNSDPV